MVKKSRVERIAERARMAKEQAHRNGLRKRVEEALESHAYCISITKTIAGKGEEVTHVTETFQSGNYLDPWFPTHHRHVRDNLSNEKRRRDKERVGLKEEEEKENGEPDDV